MKNFKRIILTFTVLILAAFACGPGSEETSRATYAAQTVAAYNAQNQPPPANPQQPPAAQPTNTQPGQLPPAAQPTNTTPPTATTKPTSSTPCDKASLVTETIPDGTEFLIDEGFTKVWTIRNDGSCTWNSAYQIYLVSGENMGGPAAVSLTQGTVAPGQTVAVTWNMIAPHDPGTYRGTYKLKNASGQTFTTNGFWVEIKVIEPVLGPPPMPPSQPIHLAATVSLGKTYEFDLDTVQETSVGADLWYLIATEEYISPQNGAEFYLWGDFEPTFDDCDFAPLSMNNILITAPNSIGSHFCFRTNEGLLGYLRIESFDPGGMDFSYVIWKNP